MAFPQPFSGLVIRYSYLWLSEHRRGLEEGRKDRPCAIVFLTSGGPDRPEVTVLPITHSIPTINNLSIEIPVAIKRRLGLDDERSWLVLTEANRFRWPGPDLRPSKAGDADSVAIGALPYAFFERIRIDFLKALRDQRVATVKRTE